MPDLEGHGKAWHRCYEYRKANGWKCAEGDSPIRLRGYTELVMSRIPPKMRKLIDSALKRGYRLSDKNDFTSVMDLICRHNPIRRYHLGYVGKSQMHVYLPTVDDAHELLSELKALAVIDEKFKGTDMKAIGNELHIRARHYAGGKGDSHQPQLKASFTHVRQIVDAWMEKDAAVRERIALWCANDDSTIRIPFDTHKEKNNAS